MCRSAVMGGISRSLLYLLLVTVAVKSGNENKLRMIGGRPTKKGTYPYVVKIAMYSDGVGIFGHICSGVVVTMNCTLTAAHCVNGVKYLYQIRGQMRLVIRYLPSVSSKIWRYSLVTDGKVHPAYRDGSYKGKIRFANDIGLLFHQPVMLESYAKLSAVDYGSTVGQKALSFGFALAPPTRIYYNVTYPLDVRMKKVIVVMCGDTIKRISPTVCVAVICGKPATMCQGDSGAPLIHYSGVIALNSAAHCSGCKQKRLNRIKSAGIYTPISPFLEWLHEELGT